MCMDVIPRMSIRYSSTHEEYEWLFSPTTSSDAPSSCKNSKSYLDHVGVQPFPALSEGTPNPNQIRLFWTMAHFPTHKSWWNCVLLLGMRSRKFENTLLAGSHTDRWDVRNQIRSLPGCLLPFQLLPVHGQKLVQLGEELRRRRAIILLAKDEADPFSWGNCTKTRNKKKSFSLIFSVLNLICSLPWEKLKYFYSFGTNCSTSMMNCKPRDL